MKTLKEIALANQSLIKSRFSYRDENRNGKKYFRSANVWIKEDQARVYAPISAFKDAQGYLDLNTGDIEYCNNDESWEALNEVREYIKSLSVDVAKEDVSDEHGLIEMGFKSDDLDTCIGNVSNDGKYTLQKESKYEPSNRSVGEIVENYGKVVKVIKQNGRQYNLIERIRSTTYNRIGGK